MSSRARRNGVSRPGPAGPQGGSVASGPADPERARDAILNLEHTGREALADLRRLLGMLRKDDNPRSLAPQPGLDQLAALIDSMRDTGLRCEYRTLGKAIDLTPGTDLVAYRVIETAILAAARHRASPVLVIIRYQPHELELEIRGHGAIPGLDQSLRAAAQRVALYEGQLRTLPADGGGFALRARLPVGEAIPA